MLSKEELVTQYVKSVREKDLLLERFRLKTLTEQELHRLLLLTCQLHDLVGQMVEAGLIQVEVQSNHNL